QQALLLEVGHRCDLVSHGRTELPQRAKDSLAFDKGSAITDYDRENLGIIGGRKEHGHAGQFIRCRPGELPEEAQCLRSALERMDHHPTQYLIDRMEGVFERGHYAEVSTTATQAPEQVDVFRRASGQDFSGRRYHIGRKKVVATQTIFAHEPTQPTAKRETRNARSWNNSARGCKAKSRRLMVQVAPGAAAIGPHRPLASINLDALHLRKVNHETAVANRAASYVMASAADR